MTLSEFNRHFGTEEKCLAAFSKWRWHEGFSCPKCGHHEYHQLKFRSLRQCLSCRRQTSPIARTPLSGTKIPIDLWFMGVYEFETKGEDEVTCAWLSNYIGISYNSSIRMRRNIIRLMSYTENPFRLDRIAELK